MAASYIPAKDALFLSWLTNFAALITAAPFSYGLTILEAGQIQTQSNLFSAAYGLSIDPATRTPTTVAQKDAQRAAAESVVRPFAMIINMNVGVSNEQKAALGLTIRDMTPTPVPPPVTSPTLSLQMATPLQHELQFRDALSPMMKRKPVGVVALELWRAVGTVAAVDPGQASFYANVTKTPFVSQFSGPDRGKIATYFARWSTRSGPGGIAQVGPWSLPLDAHVL